MPTLSIYVTHEMYLFMSEECKEGEFPSSIAKKWIEERYHKERGD